MWHLTDRQGSHGTVDSQAGIRPARRPGPSGGHQRTQHRLENPLMTNEHHDTVVVDDRGSGSGMGAIIGIIAIVVLLVAVWYFALGPGSSPSGSTTNNNNTTINPPAAPSLEVPASS